MAGISAGRKRVAARGRFVWICWRAGRLLHGHIRTAAFARLFSWLHASAPIKAPSIVPYALAASCTFEEADCLTLLGIEELMRELKGAGTRRAVTKLISRLCP